MVIATGTASGKSLAYHVPILERLLRDPLAVALYLFPTKALAQDQLRGLSRFADGSPLLRRALVAGIYDGDTPGQTRRKFREQANVILTNPDMLHQGILPYHSRWSRVLSNLKYVVVDEVHTYRGIFGSHVANVLRRLRRVARHYGADPRFILCSATIRNPGELAELLTGHDVEVVDDDGAPRGPKLFAFWNPKYAETGGPGAGAGRRAAAARARPGGGADPGRSHAPGRADRSPSPSRASRPSWSTATRASGSSATKTGWPSNCARIAAATFRRSGAPSSAALLRRTARRGLHQRARAGDRRRRARRRGARGLSRHHREHVAAGGTRGPVPATPRWPCWWPTTIRSTST